jgi:hypothetical protein
LISVASLSALTPYLSRVCRPRNPLRSYFVVAALDASRLRPRLRRAAATTAESIYAVFYYAAQPQDLNTDEPCGVITLDEASAVESYSAGSKHAFCIRLTNAQQHMQRALQSKKHT